MCVYSEYIYLAFTRARLYAKSLSSVRATFIDPHFFQPVDRYTKLQQSVTFRVLARHAL